VRARRRSPGLGADPLTTRDRLGLFLAALPSLLFLFASLLLFAGSEGARGEFLQALRLLRGGEVEAIRDGLLGYGFWAPLLSGYLQIASALIPILPGFVLAIANAMLYGPLWGGVLTLLTSLLGAAACFGLARGLGRPGIERLVPPRHLDRLDVFMARRGLVAVFLGRLIPFINPDVVSYAAGTTRIHFLPFLLAMAAGSLPATVVYSLIGGFAFEWAPGLIFVVGAVSLLPLLLLGWFYRGRW